MNCQIKSIWQKKFGKWIDFDHKDCIVYDLFLVNMVKKDTQKREHLHYIGFFQFMSLDEWKETTMGFAVKAH